MHDHPFSAARRGLLKGLAGVNAAPFLGVLAAFQSRPARAGAASSLITSPYGPIAPTRDLSTGLPLLQLPAGFSYKSFGWRGDTMADGRPCPGNHDGMGVVLSRKAGGVTEVVLVRNHESVFGPAASFIHAPAVFETALTRAGGHCS